MISTTIVLIAVPRLELIPSMPTFPSIEVKLAKQQTALHKTAIHENPWPYSALPVISPFGDHHIRSNCYKHHTYQPEYVYLLFKKINASIMVSIVLDLSIGTTLFTSPSWSALK